MHSGALYVEYHHRIRLWNENTKEPFTDLVKIVIIELPKVPDKDNGDPLWPWLAYFKSKTQEELDCSQK
jgi:hypothetical protein